MMDADYICNSESIYWVLLTLYTKRYVGNVVDNPSSIPGWKIVINFQKIWVIGPVEAIFLRLVWDKK